MMSDIETVLQIIFVASLLILLLTFTIAEMLRACMVREQRQRKAWAAMQGIMSGRVIDARRRFAK